MNRQPGLIYTNPVLAALVIIAALLAVIVIIILPFSIIPIVVLICLVLFVKDSMKFIWKHPVWGIVLLTLIGTVIIWAYFQDKKNDEAAEQVKSDVQTTPVSSINVEELIAGIQNEFDTNPVLSGRVHVENQSPVLLLRCPVPQSPDGTSFVDPANTSSKCMNALTLIDRTKTMKVVLSKAGFNTVSTEIVLPSVMGQPSPFQSEYGTKTSISIN